MGLTALAPTPAKPAAAKAPTAARPPEHVIPPKRSLAPPTCDCGSSAGLSGRCAACDRVSLSPRHAGVPEPLKKTEVASERAHAMPKAAPEADTLGLHSAVAAKPVTVREVSAVRVQTQMRVSSPSDPAEQEASAVGKTIMRMPDPDEAHGPAPPVSHRDAGVAQREAAAGHPHADPQVMEQLHGSSSSGSPLPHDMLTFMEPRFKADFSAVRIHTDQHANTLSAQLGARAFTLGRDIYFAKGEFRPDRPEGWELMAHELTHTLQQGGASHAPVAPPPKAPQTPPKQPAPAAQPAKLPSAAATAAPAGAAKPAAAKPSAGASALGPAAPKPVAAPPKPPPPKAAAAPPRPAPPKPVVAPAVATQDKPVPARAAPVHAPPIAAAAAPTPPPRVEQKASPSIQRVGIDTALNYVADHANEIPGFRMLTIILGVNPINMSEVDRSPANVLRAIIEFLPGGNFITQALDSAGVFDKVGAWVKEQLATLAITGAALKQALMTFLGSLSFGDVFDPSGVWDRAKRIFTEPIDRIKAFVVGLVTGILKLIKDAILLPLAKLAEGTKGWDLLIAVLGKNPITGDKVDRSPENLIGGFLKLIGQEEIWENMQKANAIQRAWAWFQSAMSALMGFVNQIPDLFKAAFESLTIEDVVLVVGAFKKVASVFGSFLGNFISWAGNAVWDLLKIIFDVVSPGALEYVMKTGAALKDILKNPLPFVKNLVAAAKLGLSNFGKNFGTHLKQSLIDWLTGSLQGIYIPQAFTLLEFGKFALSILGISWAQIRAKIVKALGPNGETIMKAMETGFDIVVALIKGGVGAAWELIKEKLTNLKDMVVDGIVGFVTDTIIQKAIPKLVSLFIPGAGFISAIVSIYDTIKVFIEKLSKIVAVVKAFVDSIVAIAAGQIAGAADKVESALGNVLTLVISFLANFLGLTGITEKIMGVVKKVQATVDKALDTAINFVIGKAKAFIAKLFGKGDKDKAAGGDISGTASVPFAMGSASHTLTVTVANNALQVDMASATGSLWAKIQKLKPQLQAKKSLSDGERGKIMAGLEKIEKKLDWNEVKKAYDLKIAGPNMQTAVPVPGKFEREYAVKIIGDIVDLAQKYHFTDLLASAFVPDPLPSKRYIPEPLLSNVRKRLYESGSAWATVRAGIVSAGTTAIDAEVQANIVSATKDSDKNTAMNNMKRKGKVLDDATIADFKPAMSYVAPHASAYEVDHTPSLAEHWTGGGNTMSDSARWAATEGKSTKLDFVTLTYNRSKGSKDSEDNVHGFKKTPWISPPFTSALGTDIKGTPNNTDLVSLDGKSLTDDGGAPFLPV